MNKMINITKEREGTFIHTLAEADKGDRIIYHVGQHCGGVHRRDAADANERKLCMLFCRKIQDGTFAYLAVKR